MESRICSNCFYSSLMAPGQYTVPPTNYSSTAPFMLPQKSEDAAIPGPQHHVGLAEWSMRQGIPCNEPLVSPFRQEGSCPPMQPVDRAIYTGISTPRNHPPARPREDTYLLGSVPGINHMNIQTSPTSDAIESGSLIKHSNPGPFKCLWPGCTHVRPFLRESTLLRHLRTIHISPGAYKCSICAYANGRKDKVHEHVRLVHKR